MSSPIDPTMCKNTGRLLTEWFEHPELDNEEIERMACEKAGVSVEDRPKGWVNDLPPDQKTLATKINAFIGARRKTQFAHGMTNIEFQHRLNEATKMVNPDNFKFLPDDVRERTGLEVNPLWLMECLVRSGTLSAKEQVGALKELAQYTHSKAPNISHNTNTEMQPEDWLYELAKEEYKTIDPEAVQPRQPIERGAGKRFESRFKKGAEEVQKLADYQNKELAALEAEFEEMEDYDDDG